MNVVIEPVVGDESRRGERELRYRLRGALTFATAVQAHTAGLAMLAGASHADEGMVLDCAAVNEADSGGLAVMLDWRREAARRGVVLRYENLPAPIAQLARISGVDSLLTMP